MSEQIVFKNPPIEELVFGVQFNTNILNSHIIYEIVKSKENEFPIIEDHPALPSIIEKTNTVRITNSTRQHLINKNGNKLIQLQGDRVLFNWKQNNNEEYPQYESVFKEFCVILNEINSIKNILDSINQLEIVYLDHIKVKDFGNDNYRINDIFTFGNIPYELNHLQFDYSIPLDNLNGNVIVRTNSATHNETNEKLIIINTTIRGMYEPPMNMEQWFEEAHSQIRKIFLETTTNNAKKIWKQQ